VVRRWKLSDVEVLFKVDDVAAWVAGEILQGVISHQVKVPVSTPVISGSVEVCEIFFSGSLDS